MAFIDSIKYGIDINQITNEDLIDLYCGGNMTMDDLLKALEYYYERRRRTYSGISG